MPGLQEMLVIAVVALLVFGPDRLPELARNVGGFVAKLRNQTDKGLSELRGMREIQELQRELQALRREVDGVGSDIARPLKGLDRSSGSHRMVPASHDGGRPVPADGFAPAVAQRADDRPPPTDPDAT